ncbi:hypothetical protein WJX81_004656 [Elliptochloris bilobata]|uniref:BZIP domain-containing protein n=1 Tax=Elliptochloris bilobata TaxID=381761 RepID=A0AAW1S4K8_9CHLO
MGEYELEGSLNDELSSDDEGAEGGADAEQAERASSESEEPETLVAEPEADGGTSANGRKRKRRILDGEPVQLPVSRPKDKDERIKARNRRAQQRWRDKQKVIAADFRGQLERVLEEKEALAAAAALHAAALAAAEAGAAQAGARARTAEAAAAGLLGEVARLNAEFERLAAQVAVLNQQASPEAVAAAAAVGAAAVAAAANALRDARDWSPLVVGRRPAAQG